MYTNECDDVQIRSLEIYFRVFVITRRKGTKVNLKEKI